MGISISVMSSPLRLDCAALDAAGFAGAAAGFAAESDYDDVVAWYAPRVHPLKLACAVENDGRLSCAYAAYHPHDLRYADEHHYYCHCYDDALHPYPSWHTNSPTWPN